ncbi:hypothetical protein VM1G_11435 [Cytospora mali]|uniref:Uncharacterized protein n=1 Tax=Cytospora mali TaxID=578113 RepID=A0A194VQJ7_CYTMA|nr:hypothetical protein VM1G_11435 [Valsa mali]
MGYHARQKTWLRTNGDRPTIAPTKRLDIRFPQRDQKGIPQDDEWCELVEGDTHTHIRFHDYAQVFSIPGFYDQLFGGPDSETKCVSPQVMAGLLLLDFGSGNGMIGEEVRSVVRDYGDGSLASSTTIVGFDIFPEAKAATERDRPGVYNAYVTADITEYVKTPPSDPTEAVLFEQGFNVSGTPRTATVKG